MEEKRDVLVVLLPEPKDLRRAQEQKWYRIRSRELADRIGGDLQQYNHLAFYQPDSFGSERRCIRYVAPITWIESIRRLDLLPDEPHHPRALELYYRVNLEGVEPLPRPILSARGRRILFISTSWDRLRLAEDINDLFMGSPLEEILYRKLRGLGLLPEREYHLTLPDLSRKRNHHYLLDFAIFCRDRNLDIETDGNLWHSRKETIREDNERDNLLQAHRWHVLRFNTEQINENLDEVVKVVKDAVNRYGGVLQPDRSVQRFVGEGHLAPGQLNFDFDAD